MAAVLVVLSGCGPGAPQTVQLKGAGATFPYLAYSKWIEEYKQERPAVTIEYRPVGSGEGIKELVAGTIDFAGSDMPLTDEQMSGFKEKPLHFPTLIGAVVPVYNVPGASGLNFSGEVLADIFLGRITTWSDPALAKLNEKAKLPSTPIKVVHRSDASGTTFLFTTFLTGVSPRWKEKVGADSSVQWPVGQGVQGSTAVAQAVSKDAGSIGYVELNYAVKFKLEAGAVRNQAGEFRKADFESLTAAVDAVQIASDFRTVATNAAGKQAYPIAGLTYLLVPGKVADAGKREAMKKFLTWVLSQGQKSALSLEYDLLPPALLEKVTSQINRIQ